jgi:predicted solute-binding protein
MKIGVVACPAHSTTADALLYVGPNAIRDVLISHPAVFQTQIQDVISDLFRDLGLPTRFGVFRRCKRTSAIQRKPAPVEREISRQVKCF